MNAYHPKNRVLIPCRFTGLRADWEEVRSEGLAPLRIHLARVLKHRALRQIDMLEAERGKRRVAGVRQYGKGDQGAVAFLDCGAAGHQRQHALDVIKRGDCPFAPCAGNAHVLFRGREIVRVVGVECGPVTRFLRQPPEETLNVRQSRRNRRGAQWPPSMAGFVDESRAERARLLDMKFFERHMVGRRLEATDGFQGGADGRVLLSADRLQRKAYCRFTRSFSEQYFDTGSHPPSKCGLQCGSAIPVNAATGNSGLRK